MENTELTIITDNFKDVGIEMSEVVLDSFLKDGLLKEIPGINLLLAFFKTGKQMMDYAYKKKLAAFINGYASLPKRTVKRVEKAIEDPAKLRDLGDDLLLILDKADKIVKAELIGKVFKMFWFGDISSSTFFRLCHMINRSFYDDLLFLTKFTDAKTVITSFSDIIDDTILDELFSAGWLSNLGIDGGTFDGKDSGTRYGLNSYGEIIIGLLAKGE